MIASGFEYRTESSSAAAHRTRDLIDALSATASILPSRPLGSRLGHEVLLTTRSSWPSRPPLADNACDGTRIARPNLTASNMHTSSSLAVLRLLACTEGSPKESATRYQALVYAGDTVGQRSMMSREDRPAADTASRDLCFLFPSRSLKRERIPPIDTRREKGIRS